LGCAPYGGRSVERKIIVPGTHSDHLLTRRSSRRLFGDLLKAGARIYEYEPAMIHAKTMIVDNLWGVVGSTNFDNRSFGLNDENNLCAYDSRLAQEFERIFKRDLADCDCVSFDSWRKRGAWAKTVERLASLLKEQI
jgi:cardiolipin synthase